MKKLFLLTAVFACLAVPATAHAQSPTPCSPDAESTLREQLLPLENMQDLDQFTECASLEEWRDDLFFTIFIDVKTGNTILTVYESRGKEIIAVAAVFVHQGCIQASNFARECGYGWFNQSFLDTGFGEKGSSWRSVQEDNLMETIRQVEDLLMKAADKRK